MFFADPQPSTRGPRGLQDAIRQGYRAISRSRPSTAIACILLLMLFSIFYAGSLLHGKDDGAGTIHPGGRPGSQYHFTLATHLSAERANALRILTSRWSGPIAVGFYVRSKEDEDVLQGLIRDYPQLTYSIVRQDLDKWNTSYPVNVVRNAALDAVKTEFVVLLDGDFITSEGLGQYLESQYERMHAIAEFTVWILPCFGSYKPDILPRNREEMVHAVLDTGTAGYCAEDYGDAHMTSTNFTNWFTSTDWYQTPWFYGFEPYVITKVSCAPRWDERFSFYGNDKTQYARHLFELRFAYVVLPYHFVLHVPHAPGKWSKGERKALLDADKPMQLYIKFIEEVIGTKPRCPRPHAEKYQTIAGVPQVAPLGNWNFWPVEDFKDGVFPP